MTPRQEQIKTILEDMDFSKIQSVMEHLGWTWEDSESGEKRVPNVEELSVAAEHCINKAWESENKMFNSGGFECEIIEGAIELRFVVEKANPLLRIFG
jgi:hypothetical protein